MKDSKKSDCKVFIGTDRGNSISRLLELNPNALFDKNDFIKLLIEKEFLHVVQKKMIRRPLILMEDTPLKNMAVQDTDFKHCRSRLLNKKK